MSQFPVYCVSVWVLRKVVDSFFIDFSKDCTGYRSFERDDRIRSRRKDEVILIQQFKLILLQTLVEASATN